jgi:hypothetical protein
MLLHVGENITGLNTSKKKKKVCFINNFSVATSYAIETYLRDI